MEIRCDGRRAVVTAGGSGIGLTIARTLLANGADVVVCDVDDNALAALNESDAGLTTVHCDVADPTGVADLFTAAEGAMGGVDILVNNAGIAGPTKHVEDMLPEEWERTIAVDVNGQFYCARHAVPFMRAAGRGTIVSISSTAGRLGFPLRLPYATAKRALLGFVDTLAMELGPANINVNAILPGYMLNERARNVLQAKADASGRSYEDILDIVLSRISMRTGIEEQEVADLVLYLSSEQGRHISGQHISVDGNLETYAGLDKLD